MRSVKTDPVLYELEQRVLYHAKRMGRTLPEMRFFILDSMEFASLLEKKVYPTSPLNIWEGKRMVHKKHRIETGQESSLYYEVVQTGDPSYAYLNYTNSPMMQASVMAHVVGHCEFSEINVLKDSNRDRTEFVMHLVKKVDLARNQMGERLYYQYWNSVESVVPLINPHSQFNLNRSVKTDSLKQQETDTYVPDEDIQQPKGLSPFSYTLDQILQARPKEATWQKELRKKTEQELMSRQGYRLVAPCQDILGFLRYYAPKSKSEQSILDYMYVTHQTHDFVIRTQIMNEGWAMYWEKEIMLELFKEKAVSGIIDYAKVFSGVCYPRPYFQRNPYHLGFHMWNHIKDMFAKGKVSLEYNEETDVENKRKWDRNGSSNPVLDMEHLVRTVTDYEFLRRFLTEELVFEYHLNRIPKSMAKQLGLKAEDVVKEDRYYVWIDPASVKDDMLRFFSHFYRPRIYIIDTDFQDRGLLLFHRNDGRKLKRGWIQPTLNNLNVIWKGPVSLISGKTLYTYSAKHFKETAIAEINFDQIVERMQRSQKPFIL